MHIYIRTYVDQSHINAFALILIGIIYTSPRLGSRKRGLARSLLAEASMAPRRFVHGNTAETAIGGLMEGRISIRCMGFTFVCGFCFQSHAGEGGRPVVRSLVCLPHNPDSICLLLARSLFADRLKPASHWLWPRKRRTWIDFDFDFDFANDLFVVVVVDVDDFTSARMPRAAAGRNRNSGAVHAAWALDVHALPVTTPRQLSSRHAACGCHSVIKGVAWRLGFPFVFHSASRAVVFGSPTKTRGVTAVSHRVYKHVARSMEYMCLFGNAAAPAVALRQCTSTDNYRGALDLVIAHESGSQFGTLHSTCRGLVGGSQRRLHSAQPTGVLRDA